MHKHAALTKSHNRNVFRGKCKKNTAEYAIELNSQGHRTDCLLSNYNHSDIFLPLELNLIYI